MILPITDYSLQNIIHVHNFLLKNLTLIFLVVFIVFILTSYFFRIHYLKEKKIEQYQITHNAPLEIFWTLVPCFFILSFMLPSLALLYFEENINKTTYNIVRVVANQWYWIYETIAPGIHYKHTSNLFNPKDGDIRYKDLMRLLETDQALILPVGVKSTFYITSNDVNHSWALPSFGIKVDAIPGRVNIKEITPTTLGFFSGMCSELCGVEHGFMPITVQITTYFDWRRALSLDKGLNNYSYFTYLNYV